MLLTEDNGVRISITKIHKEKFSACVWACVVWYGMVWGTRDGDPLGGLVLICREETSCAITAPSSCTKAGRSYRGGQ